MRKGEEHQIDLVDQGRLERHVHEPAVHGSQARIEFTDRGARLRVTGREGDLEVGMTGAQTQQLGAAEARSADDPHPGHSMIIRRSA